MLAQKPREIAVRILQRHAGGGRSSGRFAAASYIEELLDEELAAKAGISPETASSHLSQLLPMLIDHLTPNGQVTATTPSTSSVLEAGLDMLRGLGKAGTNG